MGVCEHVYEQTSAILCYAIPPGGGGTAGSRARVGGAHREARVLLEDGGAACQLGVAEAVAHQPAVPRVRPKEQVRRVAPPQQPDVELRPPRRPQPGGGGGLQPRAAVLVGKRKDVSKHRFGVGLKVPTREHFLRGHPRFASKSIRPTSQEPPESAKKP